VIPMAAAPPALPYGRASHKRPLARRRRVSSGCSPACPGRGWGGRGRRFRR
jgi:hypothetical protein